MAERQRDCFQIGVGASATADGSVVLAYVNEYYGNNRASVIPAPSVPLAKAIQPHAGCKLPAWATTLKNTFACQRIVMDAQSGGTPEGGFNSAGVAVNLGVYSYVAQKIISDDSFVSKGVGFELLDIILQRAATVGQALDIVSSMFASGGSNISASFLIADPADIWVFEILSGHQWAAARIPPNSYLAQPNMLRIGVINFSDAANFRTSPDSRRSRRSLAFTPREASTSPRSSTATTSRSPGPASAFGASRGSSRPR